MSRSVFIESQPSADPVPEGAERGCHGSPEWAGRFSKWSPPAWPTLTFSPPPQSNNNRGAVRSLGPGTWELLKTLQTQVTLDFWQIRKGSFLLQCRLSFPLPTSYSEGGKKFIKDSLEERKKTGRKHIQFLVQLDGADGPVFAEWPQLQTEACSIKGLEMGRPWVGHSSPPKELSQLPSRTPSWSAKSMWDTASKQVGRDKGLSVLVAWRTRLSH